MKIHPVPAALVCSALVSVAWGGILDIKHQHLLFVNAATTYELQSSTKEIVKVVKKPASDRGPLGQLRYDVTVTTDTDGEHTYSLLTLGVQATQYGTSVLMAAGTEVKLAQVNDKDFNGVFDPKVGQKLPPVGVTGRAVNADNVWLVSFKGKQCTFKIEPIPDYDWTTAWFKPAKPEFQEGHNTEPPH